MVQYKKAIRLNHIPPNMYLFSLGLACAGRDNTGRQEHGVKKRFARSQILCLPTCL